MDPRTPLVPPLDGAPELGNAIRALLGARRAGVFFDFDGTLSPLQDDPETVRPVDGVVVQMEELASRLSRIAVVSGRNAAFIRDRLGTSSKIEIHGLYGLERIGTDGEVDVDPEVAQWLSVISALRDLARAELPSDVYVEDKHLSVALHYRTALDQRAAVEAWSAEQARRTGVELQPGRMVTELRPPVDRDKGDVITDLVADLDVAWYFGDDVSDVPAFEALAKASVHCLRIGVANDNPVDELLAGADILLGSPSAVAELLRLINAR